MTKDSNPCGQGEEAGICYGYVGIVPAWTVHMWEHAPGTWWLCGIELGAFASLFGGWLRERGKRV